MNKITGLIGKNIGYSFSKKYFTKKFEKEKLKFEYKNFDLNSIDDLPNVLNEHIDNLIGFNVTIPYKKSIFKYLDAMDSIAEEIGAVNTVRVEDTTYLKGFNTDHYGFTASIKPLLKKHHKKAIIFGNGGAAKAVKYSLKSLNIDFVIVSRNSSDKDSIAYKDITQEHLTNAVIINCTPLGTHPKIETFPDIPYRFLNKNNLLFDLVYNPLETQFLKKGKAQGATTKNGLEMLELQADKSWEIWNYSDNKSNK